MRDRGAIEKDLSEVWSHNPEDWNQAKVITAICSPLVVELLLDVRDELTRLNSNTIDVETAVDKARQAVADG